MFKKGLILVLAVAMLLTLVLSACGQPATTPTDPDPTAPPSSDTPGETGGEEEPQGGRISDEKITLKFASLGWTDVRPPAEDLWMWKRYEEITNVHIEWDEIPREGYDERKNIMIAANDLPDAFYQAPFGTDEIGRYGGQGIFISLTDLIDQHAPNIKKIFEEDPATRKGLTMPDGNIYSLPYLVPDTLETSRKHTINKTWIDNLGLALPTTVEELTNILKAFKEQDANGNGDPNDEHPLYFPAGMYNEFEMNLAGSYGLANRGLVAGWAWIDMGMDNNVRFLPFDPRFKELWQQMNDWYKAGYFHPETFSGVDYARWVSDGADDKVGLFSWNGRLYIGQETGKNYAAIPTLKGPHGDAIYAGVYPKLVVNWSFMITNVNKYPVETIKWVDYFYGSEGSTFAYFGEEGITYTLDENGNPLYVDEIMNYEGGSQLGAFQWVDNVYGGCYPYIEPPLEIRLNAQGQTMEDNQGMGANDHLPFMPDEIWTAFPPTVEESEELSALLTDINAYIGEMRVKFITGEASLDTEWDTFISTLNRIGADRYLEIKQQQYDRYSN